MSRLPKRPRLILGSIASEGRLGGWGGAGNPKTLPRSARPTFPGILPARWLDSVYWTAASEHMSFDFWDKLARSPPICMLIVLVGF